EDLRRLGRWRLLRLRERILDLLRGGGLELLLSFLAPQAAVTQVRLDPLDRIPQAGLLEVLRVLVPARIVGRVMERHPVGDRLDQRWPVALARSFDRLPGDLVDSEQIIPVD